MPASSNQSSFVRETVRNGSRRGVRCLILYLAFLFFHSFPSSHSPPGVPVKLAKYIIWNLARRKVASGGVSWEMPCRCLCTRMKCLPLPPPPFQISTTKASLPKTTNHMDLYYTLLHAKYVLALQLLKTLIFAK